jgi:hypothetical protein
VPADGARQQSSEWVEVENFAEKMGSNQQVAKKRRGMCRPGVRVQSNELF